MYPCSVDGPNSSYAPKLYKIAPNTCALECQNTLLASRLLKSKNSI